MAGKGGWTRAEVLQTCPRCGAQPGERCRVIRPEPHRARSRFEERRTDVAMAPCPRCGAPAGERCVTSGGNLMRRFHRSRGKGRPVDPRQLDIGPEIERGPERAAMDADPDIIQAGEATT